jgi:chromosome partitioning protein
LIIAADASAEVGSRSRFFPAREQEMRMPRVVSVLNEKGGVGKTTTTMSLAAVTADQMNASVFVLDVDPQAGSSSWWADQAAVNGNSLPFDYDATTDVSLLSQMRHVQGYDVIFVDTPGSLENMRLVRTIAEASDYVIMPTEPSSLGFRSMAETIQKVVAPAGIPYRVLLNRVKTSRKSGYVGAFEDLDGLGIPHFRAFVREYAAHERAPLDGLVVTQYKRGRDTNNAIADYEAVAKEMWADWQQVAAAALSAPVGQQGE